jgi:hypothetical protein
MANLYTQSRRCPQQMAHHHPMDNRASTALQTITIDRRGTIAMEVCLVRPGMPLEWRLRGIEETKRTL